VRRCCSTILRNRWAALTAPVGVKQTDWRHACLVTGGMRTFDGLSIFSSRCWNTCRDCSLNHRPRDHPRSDGRRRVVIEAGADDTPTHDSRDHPPPQHISGDSATSPRPSSQRRGGRSQPEASFQVLPPTTMMRAGGRAIVLQYRRLLPAWVVTTYTFLRSARWMRVGEEAVISGRVNCCRRPVFADVPAGSDVADFRCPMCASAELYTLPFIGFIISSTSILASWHW